MWRRLIDTVLIAAGFILSPLSWWNDLVVNIPIAYFISWPFTLLDDSLFLPAFIVGYWFTNLAGFMLMHIGGTDLVHGSQRRFDLKRTLIITTVYSAVIMVLVLSNWIPSPVILLKNLE